MDTTKRPLSLFVKNLVTCLQLIDLHQAPLPLGYNWTLCLTEWSRPRGLSCSPDNDYLLIPTLQELLRIHWQEWGHTTYTPEGLL